MKIKKLNLSIIALLMTATGVVSQVQADNRINVVATFSVLGDMVKQVGGNRINLTTLVGPDGDVHVYQPTPEDAQAIAQADLLVINGVGFEGWIERLTQASNYKKQVVVATNGINLIEMEEEGHHDEHEEHRDKEKYHDEHEKHHDSDHDEHEEGEHTGHNHGDTDPHAWHSLANGKTYVKNITNGLITADPSSQDIYKNNASRYIDQINALENQVYNQVASIPKNKRKVVTPHDAFGYLSATYGIEFFAPVGFSTESEASAKDVATLIRQIKKDKISAVFVDNISDNRLINQIARETGANVGGVLYSDALAKSGQASTYLGMIKHNISVLSSTLKK